MSLLLGVNVDHVATLRQARYALQPDSPNAEPSPLEASLAAQRGGADSITIHVRGDRRHMQEADAFLIREKCPLPLNLEMGNTAEMRDLALALKPDFVCMVPETREEVTTEGGLDVAALFEETRATVELLQGKGIRVSLFIDPDLPQVEAAARTGARMIELHTGAFANEQGAARTGELARLTEAARAGVGMDLQVNAGHGLNYQNLASFLEVPHLSELNIGHSIVARALAVGFETAVREMKEAMAGYSLS
ncbi:pyridoxine 5'-phosphate synthase [Roseibacillus ishigakijimensis]|uniref:Pyridoxine 5'-phosphate synthase n=1 Tax=Roseibacillus ishigakijimensis TaxID=454146 RepID=A0A934VNC7_9BACT|nr:pyridoxine 5'-phosphate synthase [Roseibacillus ishigakijimensis]MBK1834976.1 pyridoxine 5'-phosphate synthase [Roseibacillus ishigakijimensis]